MPGNAIVPGTIVEKCCFLLNRVTPPLVKYDVKHFVVFCIFVCPFDYTAVAVSGNVGIPLTGLTTPIKWMLFVVIFIYSPKSVPQLLCNRTLQFPNIYLQIKHECNRCSSCLVTQLYRFSKYFLETIYIQLSAHCKIISTCLALDYTTVVVSGRVGIS